MRVAGVGSFPHNMLREIFQQPDTLRETIRNNRERVRAILEGLSAIRRIYFVGSGTSYHAGLLGQLLISKFTRVPATAVPSSEFDHWTPNAFDDGTIIAAISQSGESIDTLRAAEAGKRKGALLLAVTNNPGSSLARISDHGLIAEAGEEKAVTATKSYTAQLAIIYLMSIRLASLTGAETELLKGLERSLNDAPSILDSMLDTVNSEALELAERFRSFKVFFLLGSDLNYPTVLEGALKLKEACNVYAEGFAAREFLHGPVQLVNEATAVFMVAPHKWGQSLMRLSEELRNYGAPIVAVSDMEDPSVKGVSHWLAPQVRVEELLSPMIYVVPLQLFAYHSSILRGLNPDKPEKLSKVVRE
ncbi:MAG: SIS domain-containing protein [Candidatus Bathyarchaeia archaeon]|nr:SIS domain-containing protein [Candidatus Bathyarchaeota archaeon]